MNKDPESWARVNVVSVCGSSEAHIRNILRMALEDIATLARVRDAALELYMAYDGIKSIRDSGHIPVWERLRHALEIQEDD